MKFAYFDESGDPGVGPSSPTKFFVLTCWILDESEWADGLQKLVDLRRVLKTKFAIPTRPEIKATDFVRGRGPLREPQVQQKLPDRASRLKLYDKCLLYLAQQMPGQVFAVAIDKSGADAKGWTAREAAWTFALQRVDRHCKDGNCRSVIFPDEGHAYFIRRRLRAIRRNLVVRGKYGGTLQIPTERILEDPNDRSSRDSYFIQIADWAAYAAHRSSYVDPNQVASSGLWDTLAAKHLTAVNKTRGGPPAIVKYP